MATRPAWKDASRQFAATAPSDNSMTADGVTNHLEDGQRASPAQSDGLPCGFEDKRVERQKCGLIKYKIEKGVPDVGGLGWRTKQGHVLKNQSYYSAYPNTNMWNNPSHAGPATWKSFHGPKFRTDAALMETMDRFDKTQEDLEEKKRWVKETHQKNRELFDSQKARNKQNEKNGGSVPVPRLKHEYHDKSACFGGDLEFMSAKELKKVLNPTVVRGDREAMKCIAKRIQYEEACKAAWKDMDEYRHRETLCELEERMTYNQMLADLAGQPTRKRNPNRKLPNNCSEHVEVMARPRDEPPPQHITEMTDFRGLLHVDHQAALQARFPGQDMKPPETRSRSESTAKLGWQPHDRTDSQTHGTTSATDRSRQPRTSTTWTDSSFDATVGDISPVRAKSGFAMTHGLVKKQLVLPTKPVKVGRFGINLISASGLRGTNRNGLSDPFCIVSIAGKPKSKYQTRVIRATLSPVWRESCIIDDFYSGDVLEFAVYDKDVFGHDCLGRATLTQAQLLPNGASGELLLTDDKWPEQSPILNVKVVALDNYDPDGRLQAKAVRGTEDSDEEPESVHEVCRDIDEFEASLRPAPRLGNFWATPRVNVKSTCTVSAAVSLHTLGEDGAEFVTSNS